MVSKNIQKLLKLYLSRHNYKKNLKNWRLLSFFFVFTIWDGKLIKFMAPRETSLPTRKKNEIIVIIKVF